MNEKEFFNLLGKYLYHMEMLCGIKKIDTYGNAEVFPCYSKQL